MKNRKVYAIVCWIVSVIAFLAALAIGEGKVENLSKHAIVLLVMGIIWLILGILHWIKGNNEKAD